MTSPASSPGVRHFLDLDRLPAPELRAILDHAALMKAAAGDHARPLAGKVLAMIFEKPSTRTRTSFEVGMLQLGGHSVVMSRLDMQLGRGETVADTARVLSRYVDGIMIRASSHDTLTELAQHATKPVINGLTDRSHPCQLLADILTFEEHRGPIAGKTVVWCGDGNNVATSWIQAAVQFGFTLRLACPDTMQPAADVVEWAAQAGDSVKLTPDARQAVAGADCVVTDTWVSMGDDPRDDRLSLLEPYRVDEPLMALAADDALFMHCLPAHRGEEVTAGVIDGANSVVWDEAENRLHAQKAVLAWCMG